MGKPVRIKRRRAKGWKKPANTVYVGRGSRWGNPYIVSCALPARSAVEAFKQLLLVNDYHQRRYPTISEIKKHLRGKNLMCWCNEGAWCHADVLLEIANA